MSTDLSKKNVSVKAEAKETLKHEPFETRTAIEDALLNLEKADILLSYWTQVYDFAENPDPRAAVAWLSGADKSQKAEQAARWFYKYNEIYIFVDLAFDYLLDAKRILNKAINMEGKNIEEASH